LAFDVRDGVASARQAPERRKIDIAALTIMKIWVLALSLIFSSVFALADTPTIWVSTRTDGIPGVGTQSNPIDLSTPAKFDAFFQAHYANYQSYDGVIFRFLPGTYVSNSTGMWAISGWQLLGSGQGSTILKFPAVSYVSSTIKDTVRVQCIRCNWGSVNITVQDLTVDGGVRDTSTALSSSFVMPPPQESVTITVPNASKLIVGKWYYVQDTAMTNNKQQWWGIVTCTAIHGNDATLKNAEVATPGVVTGDVTAGSAVVTNVSSMEHLDQSQPISSSVFPNGATTVVSLDSPTQMTMYSKSNVTAKQVPLTYEACFTDNLSGPVLSTARLFPYSGRTGVILQSNNIVVQRVTVQDVSMPFYEGTAGIELGNQPVTHKVGSGNLIDHCTVQDVFGRYAWYLAANSAGNPAIDTGVTEEVTISNNTVLGNGYYQGIDVYNISNSVISGNNVRNVDVGFFCDTDYNRGITVINNIFTGANGTHIGVGAPAYFSNSTFKNNVIILTSPGTAIGVNGNMSNVVVSENTLSMTASAAPNSRGIIAGAYSPCSA
jgi:parallel beta-helix repeat protein